MPECHDCRCMVSPPCNDCVKCAHWDAPECKEDCQTCEYDHQRTGPYRLDNGTWSDGVDRTKRIRFRYITSRYEITVASEGSAFVWQENLLFGTKRPTHAEAIAYADRMARTNQGEDNE